MNNECVVKQKITAAIFQLNIAIERAAVQAAYAIGLTADYQGVAMAKKRMADESPLYVETIVLCGQVCRNMYDEHPGLAFFYSDASNSFKAPPYCSLSNAMHLSQLLLAEAQQDIDSEEQYDGQFIPSSIVLLDQCRNPLQEYSERYLGDGRYSFGWIEELPPDAEWPAMEEKASALDLEGCEETRWDNFDTGRLLHAQANSLRRKIQMAKSRLRIIY